MNPSTQSNLRVDNPCPFVPTARTKEQNGCNHFCKSCTKTIVDFRGKTTAEIEAVITKDTCGIFTSDQLPGQRKMKWTSKPCFYAMMVLSFLGFSVKPAYGQTVEPAKPVTDSVAIYPEDPKIPTDSHKPPKYSPNVIYGKSLEPMVVPEKKKPVFKTIGCPSF
jgi:hypothetical protein